MIHFFPSPQLLLIENEEEIKLPLCEGEHNMYGFTGGGCFSRVMWAAVWFQLMTLDLLANQKLSSKWCDKSGNALVRSPRCKKMVFLFKKVGFLQSKIAAFS